MLLIHVETCEQYLYDWWWSLNEHGVEAYSSLPLYMYACGHYIGRMILLTGRLDMIHLRAKEEDWIAFAESGKKLHVRPVLHSARRKSLPFRSLFQWNAGYCLVLLYVDQVKSSSSSTALKEGSHLNCPCHNPRGQWHGMHQWIYENIHGATKNRDYYQLLWQGFPTGSLKFCQTLHSRLARPLFVLAIGFLMATTLAFRTFLAFPLSLGPSNASAEIPSIWTHPNV